MVKSSTLFYFYNNLNDEIEIYEIEELTEHGNLFSDELEEIFGRFDLHPRQEVLDEILQKTVS